MASHYKLYRLPVLLLRIMFSSLFLVFFIALSFSQEVEPKTPKVKFKNADNFITERLDTADFQYFRGNVKIFHDSIFMFADSATIVDNDMIAVGNVTVSYTHLTLPTKRIV